MREKKSKQLTKKKIKFIFGVRQDGGVVISFPLLKHQVPASNVSNKSSIYFTQCLNVLNSATLPFHSILSWKMSQG